MLPTSLLGSRHPLPSSPAKASDPVTTDACLWLLDAPRARGMTPKMERCFASRRFLRYRPQPEQVTHRIDQIGAVHRVEMEIAHATVDQIQHLLGRDGGSDQLAGRGVVIEAREALGKPARHRGAAAL